MDGKTVSSKYIANFRKDISPPEGQVQQLLQQQQEMSKIQRQTFQSITSTIWQAKLVLNKLDGNPPEFWNFIRSLENDIKENASDESEKLSFLLQYCTGVARNSIKRCVSMDPAVVVRQISVKTGESAALYDKSIKLGTVILVIMGTIFKIRGNRDMRCVNQKR